MGILRNTITTPPCLPHPRRPPRPRPPLGPPARPFSSTSVPTTRLMLPRLLSRSAWHSSVELPGSSQDGQSFWKGSWILQGRQGGEAKEGQEGKETQEGCQEASSQDGKEAKEGCQEACC